MLALICELLHEDASTTPSDSNPRNPKTAVSFYSPNLSSTLNKTRPKHILYDLDDQDAQSISAPRFRQRRRGPRLLTSFGYGLIATYHGL
ncbi:jg13232 [Pararge aegeria aegeria]|uniref:Jg13232 protein n=1 Tax=Pararge aegeria aegeria TaxID=348720 RepID=A0A8S4RC44_9NEOP|nr:jg13232 [Pararge aegeria aegeria]